jgi:hypothetical protein
LNERSTVGDSFSDAAGVVPSDQSYTQDETARALVFEQADYLLTVKGNQPAVREQIEKLVATTRADYPYHESAPTS